MYFLEPKELFFVYKPESKVCIQPFLSYNRTSLWDPMDSLPTLEPLNLLVLLPMTQLFWASHSHLLTSPLCQPLCTQFLAVRAPSSQDLTILQKVPDPSSLPTTCSFQPLFWSYVYLPQAPHSPASSRFRPQGLYIGLKLWTRVSMGRKWKDTTTTMTTTITTTTISA